MDSDPTQLLVYMVSWASLCVSVILLVGTVLIRKLIGPWCFLFGLAMHVAWLTQALVICVVMSRGLSEEMVSFFATNVVFSQLAVKVMFLGTIIAFAIENKHR